MSKKSIIINHKKIKMSKRIKRGKAAKQACEVSSSKEATKSGKAKNDRKNAFEDEEIVFGNKLFFVRKMKRR
jgi:hypothetical protein